MSDTKQTFEKHPDIKDLTNDAPVSRQASDPEPEPDRESPREMPRRSYVYRPHPVDPNLEAEYDSDEEKIHSKD